MKKIYLTIMLVFITSAFAFCQVQFDSFVTSSSASSITVSPTGLTRVDLRIRLSKPSSQTASGSVNIIAGIVGGPLVNLSTINVSSAS
jgi:hypothetical protein